MRITPRVGFRVGPAYVSTTLWTTTPTHAQRTAARNAMEARTRAARLRMEAETRRALAEYHQAVKSSRPRSVSRPVMPGTYSLPTTYGQHRTATRPAGHYWLTALAMVLGAVIMLTAMVLNPALLTNGQTDTGHSVTPPATPVVHTVTGHPAPAPSAHK